MFDMIHIMKGDKMSNKIKRKRKSG